MVAASRLKFLLLFCLLQALTLVSANAHPHPSPSRHFSPLPQLLSRDAIIRNVSGEVQIFDSDTKEQIPQGPASDGSGAGFSPPALIWIVFSAVFGVPMALAGVRGWRLTTGTGVGLAGAVCAWAAIINSVNSDGIADLLLTIIVLSLFFLGFVLGLFEFAHLGGIALLAVTGGLAFGMRIVLVRSNLLFPNDTLYAVNWVFIALFGALTAAGLIWRQRAVIVLSCASTGSFLSFLAVDLVINKQSGMSQGLRFLFDRNKSHLADILGTGYTPPLSTRILIIVSLSLTPIFAYAQHRIFKAPFNRRGPPPNDAELAVNWPISDEKRQQRSGLFSVFWEKTPSRFSV